MQFYVPALHVDCSKSCSCHLSCCCSQIINATLDELIAKCKALVDEEGKEFEEEFLSEADPSILHFLVASGAGKGPWHG